MNCRCCPVFWLASYQRWARASRSRSPLPEVEPTQRLNKKPTCTCKMWPAAHQLELLFEIVNCKYGGSASGAFEEPKVEKPIDKHVVHFIREYGMVWKAADIWDRPVTQAIARASEVRRLKLSSPSAGNIFLKLNEDFQGFFKTTSETTYKNIGRSVVQELRKIFEGILRDEIHMHWWGHNMTDDKYQREIKEVLERTLFYTQHNREDVLEDLKELANRNGLIEFATLGKPYGCMLFDGNDNDGFKAIYFPVDTVRQTVEAERQLQLEALSLEPPLVRQPNLPAPSRPAWEMQTNSSSRRCAATSRSAC